MSEATPFRPYRPWALRLINALGRAAARIGVHPIRLDEDSLIRTATRRTGLQDFGDPEYLDALRRILSSFHDVPTTLMTRIYGRRTLLRRLTNRLQIEAALAAEPAILREPVDRPIFIVGLPRTGTTLLHRLLAEDPDNRVPLTWEMEAPVPPPTRESYDDDPRIAVIERDYARLGWLAPGFKAIHEVGARLPEECITIMANDLVSIWFLIGLDLPSYRDWIFAQDLTRLYQLHRRQLQLLQFRYRADRWVLKAPFHLHGLQWLLSVYPDARIIFTHRDPAKVVPSTASLQLTVHGAFYDELSPTAVGREVNDELADWTDRGMQARQAAEADPEGKARFVDLHYRDFLPDPIASIRKLYDAFDLTLTGPTEQRMRHYLELNRQHKHGAHRYTPEQFGLDAGAIRDRFSEYIRRFDVELEG